MTEVQKHGFVFEDWVKKVLGVAHLAVNYTQKWDVSGEIPVSVKFMGLTNALEFGSTVRIWEINQSFTLVVGRWTQMGEQKKVVSIDEITITPAILAKMRGYISIDELKEFDAKIKKFPSGEKGQEEGIKFAEKWKRERQDRMGLLTITHKIDSKNQRRLQCNLNYTNYNKLFGNPSMKTIFRNQSFTDIIDHGPRKFRDK